MCCFSIRNGMPHLSNSPSASVEGQPSLGASKPRDRAVQATIALACRPFDAASERCPIGRLPAACGRGHRVVVSAARGARSGVMWRTLVLRHFGRLAASCRGAGRCGLAGGTAGLRCVASRRLGSGAGRHREQPCAHDRGGQDSCIHRRLREEAPCHRLFSANRGLVPLKYLSVLLPKSMIKGSAGSEEASSARAGTSFAYPTIRRGWAPGSSVPCRLRTFRCGRRARRLRCSPSTRNVRRRPSSTTPG
jgi:hypothetical protein